MRARLSTLLPPLVTRATPDDVDVLAPTDLATENVGSAGAVADDGWAGPGLPPPGPGPQDTTSEGLSRRVAAALAEATEAFTTLRANQERCYRALHELTISNAAGETGYRSARRLAEEHLHLDPAEAARLIRQAHALLPRPLLDGHHAPADLPATAETLIEGRLGLGHVTVIERTMRAVGRMPHVDLPTREEVEHQLAALAADRTPGALAAAAADVLALLDPDGTAPSDTDIPTNELHLIHRRDGTLSGKFHYRDPVAAAALRTAIDAATPPTTADGDPAAGTPGHEPLRTHAERQAQGLLDLAAEALTRGGPDEPDTDEPDTDGTTGDPATGPDAPAPSWTRPDTEGGDRVHLAVTIDWDLLRSRLTSDPGPTTGHPGRGDPARDPRYEPGHLPGLGHLDPAIPVGPETARRLACDADVLPAVLGARGEPLDIGRRTRVVPCALRRALILRDHHCAHPGCRRRARRCQAHHVEHWSRGGPTELGNLVLLCSFHHAVIHHNGWTVTIQDGLPWFTPPRWLDPDQRPRHNRPWAAV